VNNLTRESIKSETCVKRNVTTLFEPYSLQSNTYREQELFEPLPLSFPPQAQPYKETSRGENMYGNDARSTVVKSLNPMDPINPSLRLSTCSSILNDEALTSLFALDKCEDDEDDEEGNSGEESHCVPDLTASLVKHNETVRRKEVAPDSKVVTELRNALAMLPENMQELFVDHFVSAVVNPDAYTRQVESMTSLAESAALEAKKHLKGFSSGTNTDDQTVALAASILESFLSRYSTSKNMHLRAPRHLPSGEEVAPANKAPSQHQHQRKHSEHIHDMEYL